MAKRGAKALPKSSKVDRGTFEEGRDKPSNVKPLHGLPIMPKWLKGLAKKIWIEKVDRYTLRGQSVKGCEDSLAQYCSLEADIINLRKGMQIPPTAMVNSHRIYAGEFYDTPASQNQGLSTNKKSNPYLKKDAKIR